MGIVLGLLGKTSSELKKKENTMPFNKELPMILLNRM